MTKAAVVLLSGGLDSMVCAALAREQGFDVLALTIDYGQRHRVEIEAARRIAARLAVRHIILPIDLAAFGGSALTADIDVPKDGVGASGEGGIPVTYVPARNTVFLSLALAWAEAAGARDLFIGVNALDYSGYPDCRPEFIAAFEALANQATRAGVEANDGKRGFTIHAPLQHLTMPILRGKRRGSDSTRRIAIAVTIRRRMAGRVGCAMRAACARRASPTPDCPTRRATRHDDLRGEGDFPYAARRGGSGGEPGSVPALCRL